MSGRRITVDAERGLYPGHKVCGEAPSVPTVGEVIDLRGKHESHWGEGKMVAPFPTRSPRTGTSGHGPSLCLRLGTLRTH